MSTAHDAIVFFANETDPFPHVLLPDPEVPCPACEGGDSQLEIDAACHFCGGKGRVAVSAFTVASAIDPPNFN
jgi:RecJ-like exonuclease